MQKQSSNTNIKNRLDQDTCLWDSMVLYGNRCLAANSFISNILCETKVTRLDKTETVLVSAVELFYKSYEIWVEGTICMMILFLLLTTYIRT